jgi:hypothetical protein
VFEKRVFGIKREEIQTGENCLMGTYGPPFAKEY